MRRAAARDTCAPRSSGRGIRRRRRWRASRCSRSCASTMRRRGSRLPARGRFRACACSTSRACSPARPARKSLAEHGADVLKISAAHLPHSGLVELDTGIGKRSAYVDLRNNKGVDTLRTLVFNAACLLPVLPPRRARPARLLACGCRCLAPGHRLRVAQRLGRERPVARPPRLRQHRAGGERHGARQRRRRQAPPASGLRDRLRQRLPDGLRRLRRARPPRERRAAAGWSASRWRASASGSSTGAWWPNRRGAACPKISPRKSCSRCSAR